MSEWEIENLPRRYVMEKAKIIALAIDMFTREKPEKPESDIEVMTPAQAERAINIFYGKTR